ncbi:MAG: amino acid ABC transporter permease [Afipia sp.]|nr:amino acid ABC transporter permease [Afipia sp.]
MTEQIAFVRPTMSEPRRAPVKTTGVVGFLRERLFGSPFNIGLTIASALLLWFTIVPSVQFLFVDAVWNGMDRTACLRENVGHTVGACWPFIQAKFDQFVYGFYPAGERWRVNLTFAIAALLLLPLLIPRAPAKVLNAGLFFVAFPFVAFFLLHGGGLQGFGVSWLAKFLSAAANLIAEAGFVLSRLGQTSSVLSPAINAVATVIIWLGFAAAYLIQPVLWLRDRIEQSAAPLWTDFVITAAIVSIALFIINGHVRTGWRSLAMSVVTFVGIAGIIAAMGLDRGGFPIVDTRQWGGLLVTLVVSVTGIVVSMPVGIALALGRRSTIPLIRLFSVVFIEFWRGVPLITVLFFATYMLPLFLPGNFTIDNLVRVLIGVALFAGSYNAEVIRGGLQAVPRGQTEAANALGLSYWRTTGLIVMPQALRLVIPGLVNSFIALFKDTTLVLIVAIFDLLGQLRAAFSDPNWATPTTLFTGFAFCGMIYFVFCFGMSRYSLFVERRLNAHRNV